MRRLVWVCALAAAAGAGERFTYEAKSEPLAAIVARLNEHFGFELSLGDGLAAKKVSITFANATGPQALRALADAAGQKLHRLERGKYRIGLVERERILAELSRIQVHVRGFNSNLHVVCSWLRSTTGIGPVLDPGVNKNQTVRIERPQSMREALDGMTQDNDLAWDVRFGVVYIAKKKRLAELPRDNPFEKLGLPEKRISVSFNRRTLKSIAAHVAAAAGVKIRMERATLRERVTMYASDIRIVDVLAAALLPHGRTLEKTDTGYVVK